MVYLAQGLITSLDPKLDPWGKARGAGGRTADEGARGVARSGCGREFWVFDFGASLLIVSAPLLAPSKGSAAEGAAAGAVASTAGNSELGGAEGNGADIVTAAVLTTGRGRSQTYAPVATNKSAAPAATSQCDGPTGIPASLRELTSSRAGGSR